MTQGPTCCGSKGEYASSPTCLGAGNRGCLTIRCSRPRERIEKARETPRDFRPVVGERLALSDICKERGSDG